MRTASCMALCPTRYGSRSLWEAKRMSSGPAHPGVLVGVDGAPSIKGCCAVGRARGNGAQYSADPRARRIHARGQLIGPVLARAGWSRHPDPPGLISSSNEARPECASEQTRIGAEQRIGNRIAIPHAALDGLPQRHRTRPPRLTPQPTHRRPTASAPRAPCAACCRTANQPPRAHTAPKAHSP